MYLSKLLKYSNLRITNYKIYTQSYHQLFSIPKLLKIPFFSILLRRKQDLILILKKLRKGKKVIRFGILFF